MRDDTANPPFNPPELDLPLREQMEIARNSPWKAFAELLRLITQPATYLSLRLSGVRVGHGCRFYGRPVARRHRRSLIQIGECVELRSCRGATPLGPSGPVTLTTMSPRAALLIGDHTGMSGGAIVATERVEIGAYTLIGTDCRIFDTDFHPISPENRRYARDGVRSSPIKIGTNVFIGAGSIITKGSVLGDDCVVGAGSVVSGQFEAGSVIAGNPARIISTQGRGR